MKDQLYRIEMKLDQLLRANAAASYQKMIDEAMMKAALEDDAFAPTGAAPTALDRLTPGKLKG